MSRSNRHARYVQYASEVDIKWILDAVEWRIVPDLSPGRPARGGSTQTRLDEATRSL